MRNVIKNSALAIAAIATLSACGKTPEAVTMEYAKAISAADLTKAKALGNAQTVELLDLISKEEKDFKKMAEVYKEFKSCKCKVTDKTAECELSDAKGPVADAKIFLVKTDKTWVIDESKNLEAIKALKAMGEAMEAAAAAEAEAAAAAEAEESEEEAEDGE